MLLIYKEDGVLGGLVQRLGQEVQINHQEVKQKEHLAADAEDSHFNKPGSLEFQKNSSESCISSFRKVPCGGVESDAKVNF